MFCFAKRFKNQKHYWENSFISLYTKSLFLNDIFFTIHNTSVCMWPRSYTHILHKTYFCNIKSSLRGLYTEASMRIGQNIGVRRLSS